MGRLCLTNSLQPSVLIKSTSRSMYLPNSGGNCVFDLFVWLDGDETSDLLLRFGTGTDGSREGTSGSVV